MKRTAILCTALLFLAGGGPATAAPDTGQPFKRSFSLSFKGGALRTWGGDWNSYRNSLKGGPWYASSWGSSIIKDNYGSDLNWASNPEMELNYRFHPNFRFSIGMERISETAKFGYLADMKIVDDESSYEFIPVAMRELRREKIKTAVTPVCFTIYIDEDTRPKRSYIGVGLGYYPATYRSTAEYDVASNFILDFWKNELRYQDVDSMMVRTDKMSAGAFGYHLVVGTEYFINRGLSLTAEVKARYAKISGFTGRSTSVVNDEQAVTGRATLIAYVENQPNKLTRSTVGLEGNSQGVKARPITPDGRVRDAEMDYSGVGLRFGATYHF